MSTFHGSTPWTLISKALKSAKKSRTVVTPYFGTGASGLLHLKAMDRLIVDASLANVTSGTVNPGEMLKLRKAGIRCFTVSGLHAKVYLTDNRAFVGSPNASLNSARYLIESCLEESDKRVCREIANWIDSLPLVPLDVADLETLAKKYHPPKFPNKKPAIASTLQAQFWITNVKGEFKKNLSGKHEDWSAGLEAKMDRTSGSEPFEIIHRTHHPSLMNLKAKAGDEAFVIDRNFDPPRVYAPMRLLDKAFVEKIEGIPVYSLAFEDYDPPSITLNRFKLAAKKANIKISASGAVTRKITPSGAAILRAAFHAKK